MVSMVATIPPLWSIRGRSLDLSKRPLVMGVLNVTPDSFSDGGLYFDPANAVERARAMVDEGADILDVGGESTRPGSLPVSLDEELGRVLPVIQAIAGSFDIPISIDTTKSEVARQAIRAGAHIINDISGMRLDPGIGDLAAETGAGLVLMHMQGTPRNMQDHPHYIDLMGEIADFLAMASAQAMARGVAAQAIAIDPGIGFGKTFDHNWEIIAGLGRLVSLGFPVLIGTSRKRFLKACVGVEPTDLLAATLATSVCACLHGARVVRVHDVRPHRKAMEAVQFLMVPMGRRDAAGS